MSSFTAWSDDVFLRQAAESNALLSLSARRQLVTWRSLTRVTEQKAPRSVSWRFTPKTCEARVGVCRVGVSRRRLRHGPITFSRWVTFALRLTLWMLRVYRRGPVASGIDAVPSLSWESGCASTAVNPSTTRSRSVGAKMQAKGSRDRGSGLPSGLDPRGLRSVLCGEGARWRLQCRRGLEGGVSSVAFVCQRMLNSFFCCDVGECACMSQSCAQLC